MPEPIKIAIILEGGVIQNVLTAGVPVEYVVVDYDTEGADADRLRMIPQDGGGEAEAYMSKGEAEVGGPFVLEAFEIAAAPPVFCVTLRAAGIQVTASTEAEARDYAKDDARGFLREHAYTVDSVEQTMDDPDDPVDFDLTVELEEEGKGRGERLWNFAALVSINVAAADEAAAPEAAFQLLQIEGRLNHGAV